MNIDPLDSDVIALHATRRGVMAHFSVDQCIGQALARYGEWAEDEIQLLRNYISIGDTVLDVGANVGVHSLAFAAMVGPSGRIIAVEGSPETCMLLSHNIVANRLSGRVLAINALAGTHPGMVSYSPEPPTENVGAKSFVNHVHDPATVASSNALPLVTTLPLITIDSFNLQACALIKIDVEGMEEDVILGGTETIRRCRPVIYFEHAADRTELLGRFRAKFSRLGYRMFWHVANPFNATNFRGHPENIFGGNVELNILALPEHASDPQLPEIREGTLEPRIPSLAEALPGVSIP